MQIVFNLQVHFLKMVIFFHFKIYKVYQFKLIILFHIFLFFFGFLIFLRIRNYVNKHNSFIPNKALMVIINFHDFYLPFIVLKTQNFVHFSEDPKSIVMTSSIQSAFEKICLSMDEICLSKTLTY